MCQFGSTKKVNLHSKKNEATSTPDIVHGLSTLSVYDILGEEGLSISSGNYLFCITCLVLERCELIGSLIFFSGLV
jgi:hypothetical protein